MEATLKALTRALQLPGSRKYHQQMLEEAERFLFVWGKLGEPPTIDLGVQGVLGSGSQASFSVIRLWVWSGGGSEPL